MSQLTTTQMVKRKRRDFLSLLMKMIDESMEIGVSYHPAHSQDRYGLPWILIQRGRGFPSLVTPF